MALLARKLFPGEMKEVHFTLYGSFAKTYRGHGTDRALMGGMLGFETDDLRIRDSLALAKKAGIGYTFTISEETDGIHPNTADMEILGTKGERLFVRGESLGGGKVKIVKSEQYFRGFYRRIQYPYRQPDRQAGGSSPYYKGFKRGRSEYCLYAAVPEEKGAAAYTVVESDEKIPEDIPEKIKENPLVSHIMLVQL